MSFPIRSLCLILFLAAAGNSYAQTFSIRIIDRASREAIGAATIITASGKSYAANELGILTIADPGNAITVTAVGYATQQIPISHKNSITILLDQQAGSMQQVIVSANRQVQRRSEAPVAISTINTALIRDTKATTIDQLVNKTPGVFMVSLGSEQHMMSIRQPMSTKGLYLYLEDGVPIRTSGIFNHNALLEMNMTAVKSIEVIRGPSSSIYGAEAIGGAINFITRANPVSPMARIEVQGNNTGYRRSDLSTGTTIGKLGISLNGYYAQNNNGVLALSDFHKLVGTLRADYAFTERTSLTASVTALDYYSDMRGSLDSTAFRDRNYSTPHSFTWREVNTVRVKTQLQHRWHSGASTSFTLVYRDNSIGQNPSYRVKDDYRRVGGAWTGNKSLAHGEINDNSFNSYAAILTHQQSFFAGKLNTVNGLSFDYSPSTYLAHYIRIQQDPSSRNYLNYTDRKDSLLSHYNTDLINAAAYTQLEYKLLNAVRLVAGLRYDRFRLAFTNHLPPSAFSGAPGSTQTFNRFTPKLGLTWQLNPQIGFYGNYSEGFVAPQVTELFNGVKVPNLKPQTFFNYEAGGWMSFFKGKLYADWSVYLLNGTNEIISIRFDDGSTGNANAGKTRHTGVEYGITFRPNKEWNLRFSGAHSKHSFQKYSEKETNFDGKEMNGAPRFLLNSELIYKPNWFPGLRCSAEWQHNSAYWMDPQNTARDKGFDVANLRLGYEWQDLEVWCHVINALDAYYSTNSSKSSFGYAYTVGNPRSFTLGIGYTFHKKN